MKKSLFLILLVVTGCCKPIKSKESKSFREKPVVETSKNDRIEEDEMRNKLNRYFDIYRLTPFIEINNVQNDQTNIQLANHKIGWLDSDTGTKIRIDNETIDLRDYVTLNDVAGQHDTLDFANTWDEIKLYKHKGRELIGIRMLNYPCNGTGCSVNYFLVYDVATKSKNFFGIFQMDNELELFDFHNDQRIDYVSKTFGGGDFYGEPIVFKYQLFSLNYYGKFLQQENKSGENAEINIERFYGQPGFPKFNSTWIDDIN